jgi:glucokinase
VRFEIIRKLKGGQIMDNYCFGIDVGGTTIKCGLFRGDGTLFSQWEIPTRTEDNGAEILPDIAQSVRGKMEERGLTDSDVAGVGVGAPGAVDDSGVIYQAVNLGWGDSTSGKSCTHV